jgi:ParB family chromosome partitioning protein
MKVNRFGITSRRATLNSVGLYEAVRALSDHDLTGLQILLTVLSFGQGTLDKLDTSDSLFNRVARDLSVDMKNHWRPDAAFFGKRNREQLVGIAKECGYADGNGSLGAYKKSELTSSLVRHFVNAHSTPEPTEAQRKAREWLPEAMLFPAVDPSAPIIVGDDDDDVVDDDHADDRYAGHGDDGDAQHHRDGEAKLTAKINTD